MIDSQRRRSSATVLVRKSTVDCPHRETVGWKRTSRQARLTTRPAVSPSHRAVPSPRNTSAARIAATASAAAAAIPVATRVPVASPSKASSITASTGRVSLIAVFQTPVTSTAWLLRTREKPQESSISYASRTPRAEPPGTVLVRAVPDWASVIACGQRSPGVAATHSAQ